MLVRLEHRGSIKGAWQRTENNREAKYYAITKSVEALCRFSALYIDTCSM